MSLPITSILKNLSPACKILFMGQQYTRDLIEAYEDIDQFIDANTFANQSVTEVAATLRSLQVDIIIHLTSSKKIMRAAKIAKVPLRIASSNRLYHWLYCNKLLYIPRKKSELHEAQYDLKFLSPFDAKNVYSLLEIINFYRFKPLPPLSPTLQKKLSPNKFNLILHCKTHGSIKGYSREWPLTHFQQLLQSLSPEKFNIFITGTEAEGLQIRNSVVKPFAHVHDVTGQLSIQQLLSLIQQCQGLVANSTGPLHLAAALGIHTLGIYPPLVPWNDVRWAPVGRAAEILVSPKNCEACRITQNCACIQEITPQQVKSVLDRWLTSYQITSALTANSATVTEALETI